MKQLILVGSGHAHVQVLRGWCRAPVPGVTLTVVAPDPLAPYSGMVPGWMAGFYRYEDIAIDVRALAAAAGARWIEDAMEGLDAPRRVLRLARGDSLGYDLLSLNVGSTLRPPAPPGVRVLSMRPLSSLRSAWHAVMRDWRQGTLGRGGPLRVTAVGGGAAGFESLLAVLSRLRSLRPRSPVLARWITRGPELLPGLAPAARRAAEQALQRAGVHPQVDAPYDDTIAATTDLLLWATGAEPHDWSRDPLRRGGLAASESGFVRIDAMLRSVSHPQVFASGDCAHWDGAPADEGLPKSGVYAVRMGEVLARNLRACLLPGEGDPVAYEPQSRALVLLATGDRRAIASRGGFGASGRWVWQWKDRIDRGFIQRHGAPMTGDG